MVYWGMDLLLTVYLLNQANTFPRKKGQVNLETYLLKMCS